MASTCGRAKSNIQADALSPIQKTHHSAAAIAAPSATSETRQRICRRQPRSNATARTQSATAEAVIVRQKSTRGAVGGENIAVHSAKASQREQELFHDMIPLTMKLADSDRLNIS